MKENMKEEETVEKKWNKIKERIHLSETFGQAKESRKEGSNKKE